MLALAVGAFGQLLALAVASILLCGHLAPIPCVELAKAMRDAVDAEQVRD